MFASTKSKLKRKALFIVSTPTQAEMFKSIIEEMPEWDTINININRWSKNEELAKILVKLDLPYKHMPGLSMSAAEKIVNEEDPDIIVIGEDVSVIGGMFLRYANSINIPTLLIQHGIFTSSRLKSRQKSRLGASLKHRTSFPMRILGFLVSTDYTVRFKHDTIRFVLKYGTRGRGKLKIDGHGECFREAVFGENVRKMLILEGVEPERIVVTGSPKFDFLHNTSMSESKEAVFNKWNIPADKGIVLLLTQYFVEAGVWSPKQRREFVEAIALAVSSLPNHRLIIKLHPPDEKEEDYRKIVSRLNPQPIVSKNARLSELLHACDLTITVSSTAALEAMALGKPVVIINLFNNDTGAFSRDSGILYVDNKKDILPALEKVLYDPKTKEEMSRAMSEFVYDQAFIQDGQASKRIADLIRNMVESTIT